MKLTLVRPYKSFRAFKQIELPNFTVITGTNGAGKSQFLSALTEGAITIEEFNDLFPTELPIRMFDSSTLIPNDTGSFSNFQSKQERESTWQQFSNILNSAKQPLEITLSKFPKLSQISLKKVSTLTPQDLLQYGVSPNMAETIHSEIQSQLTIYSNSLAENFAAQNPSSYPKLVEGLIASSSVPLIAFDMDTFYDTYPISWQPVDLFQQSFARLFSEYQTKYFENILKLFRKTSLGHDITALSEQDFLDKHGTPPWDFLNDVLQTANLNFRINRPNEYDERPYDPILTDTISGAQIRFNDLSSGERILMSFALCLYHTKDSKLNTKHPSVLLFDEIDAPLHPSMTKSLLDTIQNVLVTERGIKVILTTHSPSTVALSPEAAIYVMSKEEDNRLQKTSKDTALSLLMSGVPSLSISHENRRQVFVESHLDVQYYDKILGKLKPHLHPEISLSFIASTNSKVGGCAHVKDIVKQLTTYGNPTIRGLIDWDTSNEPESNLVVLGYGLRHSIENYLLDPLLIAILLFQDRNLTRKDLGLSETETASDIKDFDRERLQHIVDFICSTVEPSINNPDPKLVECSYFGGQKVGIPRYYLTIQGHTLEEIIKSKFPKLKQYHKSDQLKNTILSRVLDEYPSLIPACLIDAFKSLQAPIH